MALMMNEGKREYANNERGVIMKRRKKERGRRHVEDEEKTLSSCLLSILQALELGHSP